MNEQPDPRRRRRRGLAFAAAYGAVVATVAYLVAGGNPYVYSPPLSTMTFYEDGPGVLRSRRR